MNELQDRYRDAYRVAIATVQLAKTIKIVALVVGAAFLMLTAKVGAGEWNFFSAAVLAAALLSGGGGYVIAIIVASLGQMMGCQLDAAVSTSVLSDTGEKQLILRQFRLGEEPHANDTPTGCYWRRP